MQYVSDLPLPSAARALVFRAQEILIPPALMARISSQLAREGLVNTLPDHDGSLMLREIAAITFESLAQEALSIPLALPSMAF